MSEIISTFAAGQDNIIRLGGNCDANGDGAVDIADIATIIDKMAGK